LCLLGKCKVNILQFLCNYIIYIIFNTNLNMRNLKMGPVPFEEMLHRCLDTEKLQKYTFKIIYNFILHLTDFNILILYF